MYRYVVIFKFSLVLSTSFQILKYKSLTIVWQYNDNYCDYYFKKYINLDNCCSGQLTTFSKPSSIQPIRSSTCIVRITKMKLSPRCVLSPSHNKRMMNQTNGKKIHTSNTYHIDFKVNRYSVFCLR